MTANLHGKVAVVTGANRGIGFVVCRLLAEQGATVVLGARDLQKGVEAQQQLAKEGATVTAARLDVTDQGSVDALVTWLREQYGRVEILVNNAGIMPNKARVLDATLEEAEAMWQANTLGAWRMSNAVLPLMLPGGWGRIVNVSSEAGRTDKINAVATAYRVSKAALNAYTKSLADELRPRGILVNAICPGWVATDMGGAEATGTVEQGARSVLWGLTLDDSGPSGGFYQYGVPLSW